MQENNPFAIESQANETDFKMTSTKLRSSSFSYQDSCPSFSNNEHYSTLILQFMLCQGLNTCTPQTACTYKVGDMLCINI